MLFPDLHPKNGGGPSWVSFPPERARPVSVRPAPVQYLPSSYQTFTSSSMAKGTLHASAGTTKKGGVASRASTKNGKSSIVGSQDSSTGATSKKAKTSTAASKKSTVKKEQKPAVSEESDNDDIQFVERDHQRKDGAAAAGPRHLDVKGKTYDKHYKAVVRDALEGMPLCMCSSLPTVLLCLLTFADCPNCQSPHVEYP